MLLAGKITGAYGIKGWVKVHSFTDPPENILNYKRCRLVANGSEKPVTLLEARRHGKGLVARIDGLESREAAQALSGAEIRVAEEELPELEEGEFYWHQLCGLQVWCDHQGELLLLGEVDHLIETGANDVLVTRPCAGSIDDRERLIPYLVGSVVRDVDRDRGRITVQWHPDD